LVKDLDLEKNAATLSLPNIFAEDGDGDGDSLNEFVQVDVDLSLSAYANVSRMHR